MNNFSTENAEREYDRKRQPGEIAVGTQVLLELHKNRGRVAIKLEPAWLGPYNIDRCVGKGVYELSKDGKIVKKKANAAQLKIYKKRPSENDDMTCEPYSKKVISITFYNTT